MKEKTRHKSFCPQCGHERKIGEDYCPKCGELLAILGISMNGESQVKTVWKEEGIFYEKCPKCGSYDTIPDGTSAGDPCRKCNSCENRYILTPFTYSTYVLEG